MRALLVCAGLVFRSAWGTANTQPVPARDSVEATLTDEAAWWEHATSLIESTIRTYGGDRGLRVSTLAQESTSGEFVQAGSNPALIHTQEGGAVYTADVRQRLGVVAGPADPPASLTGSPGTGTIVRSGATLTGPHPLITDEAARWDVLLVLAGEGALDHSGPPAGSNPALILSPMDPDIRDDRPPGRRISDEEAWHELGRGSTATDGSLQGAIPVVADWEDGSGAGHGGTPLVPPPPALGGHGPASDPSSVELQIRMAGLSDEEAWSWRQDGGSSSVVVAGHLHVGGGATSSLVRAPVVAIAVSEPGSSGASLSSLPEDRSTWQLTEAEMRQVLTRGGWVSRPHEGALHAAGWEGRWFPGT